MLGVASWEAQLAIQQWTALVARERQSPALLPQSSPLPLVMHPLTDRLHAGEVHGEIRHSPCCGCGYTAVTAERMACWMSWPTPSSMLLPLIHSQDRGILRCFCSCLWTLLSSIRKLRIVCARLRRSMGKRTENQGKNASLNTGLDPTPYGAVSSFTSSVYESNICSESTGLQHKTHFHCSISLLIFPPSQTLLASPAEGSFTSPIAGRWASIKLRERVRIFCHSIFLFFLFLFPSSSLFKLRERA